ncbi:bacillithiol system redox-active protein YtxJ [Exiguobacterium sp. RIT594]|uniref:bacillithiol system redox-active protein YtxJ n=1 Tax=Exiguobacterium sp. RIT594 TaxID=2282449 RepID=UPI000DF75C75|nr:bacillithiol system redox-active protein YtxJ [Exiguobacterium sp. RIT594]RDB32336.1 bacillithiol system redox-active protein YtxJ [Exiguobacterium sp. RIT594]
MTQLRKLQSISDFDQFVSEHATFVICKHSTTCPISSAGFSAYMKYADTTEIPTAYLLIQEARTLSNHIAEQYNVRHESPQVLFIQDGKAVFTTSHYDITTDALHTHVG